MHILMVCLGNICRSPMADGWLRHRVNELELDITVDSAGTADYHCGSQADHRMRRLSKTFGVDIDGLRARQFSQEDFDTYDRIFVMDKSNLSNVLKFARNDADAAKVSLYLNELFPGEDREVPDPYYGDDKDFIHVIELLKDTTEAFLKNTGKIQ